MSESLKANHTYRILGTLYRCLKITESGNAVIQAVKKGCLKQSAPGSKPIIVSRGSEAELVYWKGR